MDWLPLESMLDLSEIQARSFENPQVIFKHSTRCSISVMAKSRLERSNLPVGVYFYYLDLLKHRDISNEIATRFNVYHESPQVLILRNGECIYDESHNGITMAGIEEALGQ